MQIDYTALRSIKSGHTVDLPYTIEVLLSRQNRKYSTIGNQTVALSGNTITTIHRYDSGYDLTTAVIQDASTPDNADMIEFLDSVAGGEVFSLDLTGTLETYILASINRPYRAARMGHDELYTYSFSVRAL